MAAAGQARPGSCPSTSYFGSIGLPGGSGAWPVARSTSRSTRPSSRASRMSAAKADDDRDQQRRHERVAHRARGAVGLDRPGEEAQRDAQRRSGHRADARGDQGLAGDRAVDAAAGRRVDELVPRPDVLGLRGTRRAPARRCPRGTRRRAWPGGRAGCCAAGSRPSSLPVSRSGYPRAGRRKQDRPAASGGARGQAEVLDESSEKKLLAARAVPAGRRRVKRGRHRRAREDVEQLPPVAGLTRKSRPRSAFMAVAPGPDHHRGVDRTRSRPAATGGRRGISRSFGVSWMRRPPRGVHLKCLTALVTYTRSRDLGLGQGAVEQLLPAGPTNGRPLAVLDVAGLLAHEHQLDQRGPLAEDRLRAGSCSGQAGGGRTAQPGEAEASNTCIAVLLASASPGAAGCTACRCTSSARRRSSARGPARQAECRGRAARRHRGPRGRPVRRPRRPGCSTAPWPRPKSRGSRCT